jgi:hypothetical protein
MGTEIFKVRQKDMDGEKLGEGGGVKFGGKYDQLISWGSPKITLVDNSVTWFDSPFAYEFDVTNEMISTPKMLLLLSQDKNS